MMRATVAWIQRTLLDRVIAADIPPKEVITVDELPRNDDTVDQPTLLRALHLLAQWENIERLEAGKYQLVKVEPKEKLPFLDPNYKPSSEEQETPGIMFSSPPTDAPPSPAAQTPLPTPSDPPVNGDAATPPANNPPPPRATGKQRK